MPATIKRSAQNSNVYRAYGIMSRHSCARSVTNAKVGKFSLGSSVKEIARKFSPYVRNVCVRCTGSPFGMVTSLKSPHS
jgi:hypothetical protein